MPRMIGPNELQKAVVTELRRLEGGRSAADVVNRVAKAEQISGDEVRRQLRTLLERGEVQVGPKLNLVVPDAEAGG